MKTHAPDVSVQVVDGHVAQTMIDSSSDCIKMLEADGRLSYMSQNGMVAMEIDDFALVKNQLWWNLWPEKHRQTLINSVEAANRGIKISFQADCPTAKGTDKSWLVTVMQIKGGSYDNRLLAVSVDISEQLRIEKLRAQLEIENQALSRFSHLLAHDLKNPLRHIKLLSERLNDNLVSSSDNHQKTTKLCHQIALASESVLNMVSGLQNLANASNLVETDHHFSTLAQVIQQARNFNDDKAIVFEISADTEQYGLIGNQGLLISVFNNLFENSLKYAGKNPVTIKIDIHAVDDDLLVVDVSDDGIGFTKADCHKVLKPMVRGSNTTGKDGHGMGLSLIEQVIRSHGGWISIIDSSKRTAISLSGALIRFALPYSKTSIT